MSHVQSRSLTIAGGEHDTSSPVGPARDLSDPLQALHDLCDRGLYVQAFRLGQRRLALGLDVDDRVTGEGVVARRGPSDRRKPGPPILGQRRNQP